MNRRREFMKKSIFGWFAAMVMIVFGLWPASVPAAAPDKEKVLNIYLAYDNPEMIFKEFEKATGINTQYLALSSGEVLTRLRAEKANPQTDVWFGGGSDSFIEAVSEGLLDAYKSANVSRVDAKFRDRDGYWTGVSLSMVAFLANNARLTQKKLLAPKSWADLVNPVYKGELIASNPNISGTAYTQISGTLQMMGEAEGWKFMDKLYANVPYLEKTGGGPRSKTTAGEFAVAICPDPQGAVIGNPNAPLTAVFPADGVLAWPSPVSVVKGAKHPGNARIFVDWALSDEGQQVLMRAIPRVPTTPAKPIAGVPKPGELKMIAYDFIKWGKERERVLKLFNARYSSYNP
jgi:iron(III) transport system substrate-binding protein